MMPAYHGFIGKIRSNQDGDSGDFATVPSGSTPVTAEHKPVRRRSTLKSAFYKLRRPPTETGFHDVFVQDAQAIPPLATARRPSLPINTLEKRPIASLPRQQTFKRQESEKREKLSQVQPGPEERRATSVDRRRSRGLSLGGIRSLSPRHPEARSAAGPEQTPVDTSESRLDHSYPSERGDCLPPPLGVLRKLSLLGDPQNDPCPLLTDDEFGIDDDCSEPDRSLIREEYERRWILNLSMNFRDGSQREKFFVTFAEKPNLWRRVTVSLDYRNAPPESLEADLKDMTFQRDKSFRIFDAIRESLPEIQYYNTVTNLKLETTSHDNQLHIHVREDANEVIAFPSTSIFRHVGCQRLCEGQLDFDHHLSGFVYRVRVGGRVLIKKEIPGPDTVDEFLYEVNALNALSDSKNVIRLEGLVTNDRGDLVKGLLISYAERGALIDMLYDHRSAGDLSWQRREKWARQIVTGLSEIHEAGFVQGDFTLSNIVIDETDTARIIDINRRGCPVGWEPPEFEELIKSGQRISMSIGVKSDLYQLGMVLWAIADMCDEPERMEKPLRVVADAPHFFRAAIESCMSARPQDRKSALSLLEMNPEVSGSPDSERLQDPLSLSSAHGTDRLVPCAPTTAGAQASQHSDASGFLHGSGKVYINPEMAVTLDDCKELRRSDAKHDVSEIDHRRVQYLKDESLPASTTYQVDSTGSLHSRGRSSQHRRRQSSPEGHRTANSSATSLTLSEPGTADILEEQGLGAGRTLEYDLAATYSPSSLGLPDRRQFSAWRRMDAGPLSAAKLMQQHDLQLQLQHMDSGFDETMADANGTDGDGSQSTEKNAYRRSSRPSSWSTDGGSVPACETTVT